LAEECQAIALHGRPLRVAMVSKATSPGGGASRVATDLGALLREDGHVCDHWVGYYSKEPKPWIRQLHGDRLREPFRWLRNTMEKMGILDSLPLEALFLLALRRNYDLIHVHDTATAMTTASVSMLASRVPTVWTFHDQSAFTGGCLYSMDCLAYLHDCDRCPQLDQWPVGSSAAGVRRMRKNRRRAAVRGVYTPVVPSRWMAEMASETGDFTREIEVIPNGVNTDVFRPHKDKMQARRQLGIHGDVKVVLISAGHLSDPRKGVWDVIDMLGTLGENIFILAVGKEDETLRKALHRIPHQFTGYIHDPQWKAYVYACADVCVYCSFADNHPLTLLETMACGVPTVAYDVGGVGEIINQPGLGALVAPGDRKALLLELRSVLQRGEECRLNCREHAVQAFSYELFLRRHINLYRKLAK